MNIAVDIFVPRDGNWSEYQKFLLLGVIEINMGTTRTNDLPEEALGQ